MSDQINYRSFLTNEENTFLNSVIGQNYIEFVKLYFDDDEVYIVDSIVLAKNLYNDYHHQRIDEFLLMQMYNELFVNLFRLRMNYKNDPRIAA